MARGQTPGHGRDGPLAAVVLAAGEASRFGAPKQRLLLPRVLARLADAPLDDVVVVAGAYPLDDAAGTARVVTCPEWQRGPGASLRCGLAALPPETEAAVVVLADGPNLAPEAVVRVVAAWRKGAGPVVAAAYDGERGHPLLVARELWDAVPDAGLRALEPTLVPCDDLGWPGDVDTRADLP
jgi:CTP:molybdopterin cytidylyltransferase MocA